MSGKLKMIFKTKSWFWYNEKELALIIQWPNGDFIIKIIRRYIIRHNNDNSDENDKITVTTFFTYFFR